MDVHDPASVDVSGCSPAAAARIQRDERARIRIPDREGRYGARGHTEVVEPDDAGQERPMDPAEPDLDVAIRANERPTAGAWWVIDRQHRAVWVVGRDTRRDITRCAREEPVLLCIEAGCLTHLRCLWSLPRSCSDVPRRSNRTGVGGVLLGPSDHEGESKVDHQSRDDQQRDEPAGEYDENLSGLAVARLHRTDLL